VLKDYGELQEWCHGKGQLGLNPLYETAPVPGDGIRLTRRMPSRFYQDENRECERYLPAEAVLQAEVLDDLSAGRHTREIDRLIEQYVVLDIPSRYG
jgi:hypothetical protein